MASNQNMSAVCNWTVCQARAQWRLCNHANKAEITRKNIRFQVVSKHVNSPKTAFHKQEICNCTSTHTLFTFHDYHRSNSTLCSQSNFVLQSDITYLISFSSKALREDKERKQKLK